MTSERDKLWSAASALIEGLGPKFGMWKGTALNIAYKNIYNTEGNGLSDEEVWKVVGDLSQIMR
jgi:hypothetical protein